MKLKEATAAQHRAVAAIAASLLACKRICYKTQASYHYYDNISGTDRVYTYEHSRLHAHLNTITGENVEDNVFYRR